MGSATLLSITTKTVSTRMPPPIIPITKGLVQPMGDPP